MTAVLNSPQRIVSKRGFWHFWRKYLCCCDQRRLRVPLISISNRSHVQTLSLWNMPSHFSQTSFEIEKRRISVSFASKRSFLFQDYCHNCKLSLLVSHTQWIVESTVPFPLMSVCCTETGRAVVGVGFAELKTTADAAHAKHYLHIRGEYKAFTGQTTWRTSFRV